MSSAPVRTLLVDDYVPLRHELSRILASQPRFQIVGEASDGLEAVSAAQQLHPDLVLLDIGLPHLNGIQVAAQLQPAAKIVFVTQNESTDIATAAMDHEQRGYVLKSDVHRELLTAIENVLAGRAYLCERLRKTQAAQAD